MVHHGTLRGCGKPTCDMVKGHNDAVKGHYDAVKGKGKGKLSKLSKG